MENYQRFAAMNAEARRRASPERLPGETRMHYLLRSARNFILPPRDHAWGTRLEDFTATTVSRADRMVIDGNGGARFVPGDGCCSDRLVDDLESTISKEPSEGPTPPHQCANTWIVGNTIEKK